VSVNQRHLQDTRKIDPDASIIVGREFQKSSLPLQMCTGYVKAGWAENVQNCFLSVLSTGVPKRAGGGQWSLGFLRREPGQQHDLAAEPTSVDTRVDIIRGAQWFATYNHRMNGPVVEQIEQSGHVSPKLFRVRQAAVGDAVPERTTAAEQEAQCSP
jgi:hypothetical protein